MAGRPGSSPAGRCAWSGHGVRPTCRALHCLVYGALAAVVLGAPSAFVPVAATVAVAMLITAHRSRQPDGRAGAGCRCRASSGETHELGRLDERLAAAATGHPQTVVVEGPAGIGKSALLAGFASRVDPERLLTASGDEDETFLPFGLLQQLTGLSTRTWDDPFVAGADLLRLLDDRSGTGPTVLVVDDAHLADTASLRALTFALRRLRADRVLTLVATPEDDVARLPKGLLRLADADDNRLRLTGLDRPGGGRPAARARPRPAPADGRAAAGAHRRQPAAPGHAARRGTGGGARRRRADASRARVVRTRRARPARGPHPGRAGAGARRGGPRRRLAPHGGRGGGRPWPARRRRDRAGGRGARPVGPGAGPARARTAGRCGSATRWCGRPWPTTSVPRPAPRCTAAPPST